MSSDISAPGFYEMVKPDYSFLPEPFLGRLVIETIKEDADAWLKKKLQADTNASSEFMAKFQLATLDETVDPETGRKKYVQAKRRVPITRGKIIKKAPDAFGKRFEDSFGDVGYKPDIGDTILFIPNESFRLDADDTYHTVLDTDIVGYIKATKEVVNG